MANLAIANAVRLGEQLVGEGLISEDQLAEALARQQEGGDRIGGTLVSTGAISAASLVQALSGRFDVKGCVLRHGLIDPKEPNASPRRRPNAFRCCRSFASATN